MNANNIIIPQLEETVASLDSKFNDQIPLQAKHDAGKDHIITKSEYIINVINPVQSECQEAINTAKQHGQLWAHIVNANEYEQQSVKECLEFQFKHNEKERHKKELENKKALLQLDPLKFKYGSLFLIIATCVGVADATIAYLSFRHVYPIWQSFCYSLAVAAMIVFTHYAYTPWILKEKKTPQMLSKGLVVLVIAFCFFFWIATLRAQVINDTIHIAVSSAATLMPQNTISPWPLCIISFALFLGVFFTSFSFWKTKEERLQWEAYTNLTTEIKKTEKDMEQILANKKALEASVFQRKQDVRLRTNYIKQAIERIKSIADRACNEYKKVYAQ